MLSYEEFKEELIKQTKENMPQRYRDAEVEIIRVPKNNDRMFEGISVRPQDKGSGTVFYCVDAYLDYLHNESLEKTISLYLMRLVHYLDHMPEIDAEDYQDWKNVKGRIVPQLVSMRKNCESIQHFVHRPVEGTDLAVIYRIMQDMGQLRGSIKISNELMEKWGVDLNRIHVRAFYNMNTILTPQIVELGPETEEGGKPEVYTKLPEHMDRDCMYVFTNQERFYGASTIMASGILSGIAERLQSSFYLLPLTVDDMMIIPQIEDEDVEELQKLVLKCNICAETEESMLSDQVYFYDSTKREISMATDPAYTQEVVLKMLEQSVSPTGQTDESDVREMER